MTANEFLAGIENYEKFDPSNGTVEGKTYVVVPTTTATGKNLRDRHLLPKFLAKTSQSMAFGKWIAPIPNGSGQETIFPTMNFGICALSAKQPNLPKRTLSPPQQKKTRLKKLAMRP